MTWVILPLNIKLRIPLLLIRVRGGVLMGKRNIWTGTEPGQWPNIMRRAGSVIAFLAVTGLLLFGAAGTIAWAFAWAYLGISLVIIGINSILLPPEVIEERGRKKQNTESWDRVISGLIIIPWLATYVAAGLDYRWQWTPQLAVGWHLLGLSLYISGNALVVWAISVNRFFSTAVRIQFERGHTVCSAGPYRYVRHPGYLGMITYIMASPLFLGSLWAILPALITAILFIIRTGLEDKTLIRKLPGYEQYTAHTKYRLFPGVW